MHLVNRHAEIQRFEQALSPDSPEWILNIFGIPGIGTTALLHHLLQGLDDTDWFPVLLDFNLSSCRERASAIFEALTGPLQAQVPSVAWESYQERIAEIESNQRLVINQTIHAKNRSTIMHPTQNLTVNMGREGARILDDARHQQARAWIELATHLDQGLIMCIDNWAALIEHGQDDLRAWVVEDLLLAVHQALPRSRAVVGSLRSLETDRLVTNVISTDAIATVKLEPLSRKDAISMMAQSGVSDREFQDAVFERVGGHPGLIGLAVALWRERPSVDLSRLVDDLDSEAASAWFVGQLIDNMKDSRSRKALERGVVLQQWMLEMLAAVSECQDLDSSWYKAFVDYPFVQDSETGRRLKKFVELVRRIRLRQIWEQQRTLFRQLHGKALEWYTETDGMGEEP